MTFPVLTVEEAQHEAPTKDEAPKKGDEGDKLPTPRVVSNCPACDGSGQWRGIDGFVFVCTHCVYEMT